MATRTANVGVFALLELLSFVTFCEALDHQLRGLSSLRQLAFVLHTHRSIAQTMMLLWLLFVVQLSLEHAGTDYSFKFAWLSHSK